MTDVDGVRGPDGRVASEIAPTTVRRWIADGTASEGMIPKLEGAADAVRAGARRAWIGPLEALGTDGPRPASGTELKPALPTARRRIPLLTAAIAKGKVP